jgi:hypothetical protein
MANIEGALRMMRAGLVLIQGGACAMFLGVIGLVVASRVHGVYAGPALGILLVYLGVLPSLAGVVLWVAGWIVEGFLLPRDRE